MSSLNIQAHLARLEQVVISLDKKVDCYSDQSNEQHQDLKNDLISLSQEFNDVIEKQNDKLQTQREDILTFKRDKAWMISIFGLFWGIMVIYIQLKLRGVAAP